MQPLAETWECSTHPDGPSLVASGAFSGKTLAEVLQAHPEYLGTHPAPGRGLPILIKLIDAQKDLSVQVHPDDAYAQAHEQGQLGKSEMWYVLDAAPDAHLVYGLRYDMSREKLRRSVEKGNLLRHLQKIPIRKGDVFYIPAGTIHAIGAGALVAEIQQSSNLTYRLYDYDRVDKDGRKRALQLDRALEAACLKSSAEPVQPMRVLRYRQGCASELLCRCRHFEVYRMLLNTERQRGMVAYQTDSTSFRALLCISGCGSLFWEGGSLPFFKGDCIFVPADSCALRLHGRAQFLEVKG